MLNRLTVLGIQLGSSGGLLCVNLRLGYSLLRPLDLEQGDISRVSWVNHGPPKQRVNALECLLAAWVSLAFKGRPLSSHGLPPIGQTSQIKRFNRLDVHIGHITIREFISQLLCHIRYKICPASLLSLLHDTRLALLRGTNHLIIQVAVVASLVSSINRTHDARTSLSVLIWTSLQ